MDEEIERANESAWRLGHAKLDAALVRGIVMPRLDAKFDRAVWARIEAEQRNAVVFPAHVARQLRSDARLAIINWVAGGVVAIGTSIAFAVAAASGTTLASLGAVAVPGALALGAAVLLYGLATASPLRSRVSQYI